MSPYYPQAPRPSKEQVMSHSHPKRAAEMATPCVLFGAMRLKALMPLLAFVPIAISIASGCGTGATGKEEISTILMKVESPPDASATCSEIGVSAPISGRKVIHSFLLGPPGTENIFEINDAPAGDNIEVSGRLTRGYEGGKCVGATAWTAKTTVKHVVPGDERRVSLTWISRASFEVDGSYEDIYQPDGGAGGAADGGVLGGYDPPAPGASLPQPTAAVAVQPGESVVSELHPAPGETLTITMSKVDTGGVLTVRPLAASELAAVPEGFAFGSPPQAFFLENTSGFSNSTACLTYGGSAYEGPQSSLRFIHFNERSPAWEDVTASVDEAAKQICAKDLLSFSPLAVVSATSAPNSAPASCVLECSNRMNECTRSAAYADCDSAYRNCVKTCGTSVDIAPCEGTCVKRGECLTVFDNSSGCWACLNACAQAKAATSAEDFGQVFRGATHSVVRRFTSPHEEPFGNPRGKSTMYVSFSPPDSANPTRGCETQSGVFTLPYGCRFELAGDNGIGSRPEGQNVMFAFAPPSDLPDAQLGIHEAPVYIYHEFGGKLVESGRVVIRLRGEVLPDVYENVGECERSVSMAAGWSSKTETGGCEVTVPEGFDPIGGPYGTIGLDPAAGYADPFVTVVVNPDFNRVEAFELIRDGDGRRVTVNARVHRPSRNRAGARVTWRLAVFAKRTVVSNDAQP